MMNRNSAMKFRSRRRCLQGTWRRGNGTNKKMALFVPTASSPMEFRESEFTLMYSEGKSSKLRIDAQFGILPLVSALITAESLFVTQSLSPKPGGSKAALEETSHSRKDKQ